MDGRVEGWEATSFHPSIRPLFHPAALLDRLLAVGYALCMSNLVYFEYALVLPEERYLIEVQTRDPATGETRGNDELENVAKEALVTVIGKVSDDLLKNLKPNVISESNAQNLTKVQKLLSGPDFTVFLVE
jgi:hypothetical protein